MTDNVTAKQDYCRKRIERDIAAYLKGGRDFEHGHQMIAHYCDVSHEVVRQIWANARAERQRERSVG